MILPTLAQLAVGTTSFSKVRDQTELGVWTMKVKELLRPRQTTVHAKLHRGLTRLSLFAVSLAFLRTSAKLNRFLRNLAMLFKRNSWDLASRCSNIQLRCLGRKEVFLPRRW